MRGSTAWKSFDGDSESQSYTIQCDCIGQGGILPHDPRCFASPEYRAGYTSEEYAQL
jgi:hypothetical protein